MTMTEVAVMAAAMTPGNGIEVQVICYRNTQEK